MNTRAVQLRDAEKIGETFPPDPSGPVPVPSVDDLTSEAARLDGNGGDGSEAPEVAEPSGPKIPSNKLIRPLLVFTFDVYAPRWKVPAVEIDMLADAYGALADDYFPDGIPGRYGLWFNAIMMTVAVFQPRINTPPRDAPPQDETPAAQAPVETTPAPGGWGPAPSVL